MIHFHKKLHYGQVIVELTTIMTQIAKAQHQQTQASKQVHMMEGVYVLEPNKGRRVINSNLKRRCIHKIIRDIIKKVLIKSKIRKFNL